MRYARNTRGSALLMTLILSMALASTVIYAVSDTLNASVDSRREDNYARALAAAEYGAELAIAEIGNGVSASGTSAGAKVDGDFVVGSVTDPAKSTLYDNGVEALDQRRITGTYGEQEFRVRVRSARQVYGNPDEAIAKTLIESGWLKAPENADKELTELKAYEFRDTYEITSTARNETISAGGSVPAELALTPVVRAIVTFDYYGAINKMLSGTGLIHGEDPANLQLQDRIDAGKVASTLTGTDLAYANPFAPVTSDENLTITGEDHYLVNYHNNTVTIGKKLQPMKLKSNETNYFGATGSYWEGGNITFNYRQPKDPINNNNLIARDNEAINPYRPLTTEFSNSDKNKAMFVANKKIPYDMYLLGGKRHKVGRSNGNDIYEGRTVTVVNRDEEFYGEVMGKISETNGSSANPGADFDIVLPRYEDLRNMYINVTNADSGDKDQPSVWKQMYVGQYTNSRRGTTRIREYSVPLLAGTKIRPQSIHTVRNKENQILVRLFAGPEDKNGNRTYYKYKMDPDYEIRDVYELYEVNGFSENHAETLNKWASSPKGSKGNDLDEALKTGAFVERDGKYWMESDKQHTVKHPVTGETRTTKIWFEFRPCKLGESLYNSKKYYGNFWAIDAASGKEVEEPQSGFKDLRILVPVYVGQKPVLTKGNEWTGYYVWAHAFFTAVDGNDWSYGNSGKDGSGFILDEKKEQMTYNRKNKNTRLATGRIFPWQELVGYSLVKRTDATGKGDPAIIDQSDGGNDKRTMYANAEGGRAVRPAERVEVGFDEVYQASADRLPTKFQGNDYNYQPDWHSDDKVNLYKEHLGKHPLFDEKSPGDLANYRGYLEDRDDPIRVLMLPENASGITAKDGAITGYKGNLDAKAWNPGSDTFNPDIKTYDDMGDFLFEKEFNLFTDDDVDAGTGDIGDEVETERKVLQAVNIMGGYEDLNEDGADNDYADLMFTVYIAYEEREDEAYVIARSNRPWWERDETEGLTGDKALLAVSFNGSTTENGTALTSDELRSGAFANLGSDVGDGDAPTNLATRVWTMANEDGTGFADFPRAIFLTGEGIFELDTENDLIKSYLKKWEDEGISGNPVFYFTDFDAVDRLIQRVGDEQDLSEEDLTSLNELLIEEFAGKGYEMRHIDDRYGVEESDPRIAALLVRDRADMVDEDPSSLGVSREEVFVREIAGAFAGSKDYNVPAVKTENYSPIDENVSETLTKSFIAGEAEPIVGSDGRLSFDSAAIVPFRTDALEIEGDTYPAEVRKVGLGGRAFLSTGGNTKAAVDALYIEPYAALDAAAGKVTRASVWSEFGMKDRRGSIGYHRAGDLSDLFVLENLNRIVEGDFPVFLDRYEPTILAPQGMNNFRLTSNGDAIVQELLNPDAPEGVSPVYASAFTYQGNKAATFVIDRPLDGAGVMLVNGNLVVEDTFAYHGILIVTGDLIIRPTLKRDQFVWSIDGWPVDAYDHKLIPSKMFLEKPVLDYDADYGIAYDDTPEGWFYLPDGMDALDLTRPIPEDKKTHFQLSEREENKGEPLRDDAGSMIPVLPRREHQYRGELILQGKLLVKGRIITQKVQEPARDDEGNVLKDPETGEVTMQDVTTPTDPGTGLTYPVGKLNAYWSKRAVDAMAGMFPLGKPTVQRVSWTHDDDIRTDSIWKDTQESVEEVIGDIE